MKKAVFSVGASLILVLFSFSAVARDYLPHPGLASIIENAPTLESLALRNSFQVRSTELPTDFQNFAPRALNLDLPALITRVKSQSYAVRQDAERVFQARQRVRASIGNLLPHIRPGGILAVALTGPAALLGLVGDLLPFLFPSNWFQMRATQRLLQAEKKSFASLRGNEIFDVESLYYAVSRDQQMALLLESHLAWLDQVTARLRAEEIAGTLTSGSADYFQLNILKLMEEQSNLRELLGSERAALLHGVALNPTDATLQISPANIPDLSNIQPIVVDPYLAPVQERSLELDALDWLIQAAGFMRGAATFGFLDPNSDQSIGFAMATPIRIARSEQRGLGVLKQSTASLIAQKLSDTVLLHNESLKRFEIAKHSAKAAQAEMIRLVQRHDAGDEDLDPRTFIEELARLQEELLSFEVRKSSEGNRFLVAKARLNRLMLSEHYTGLESP